MNRRRLRALAWAVSCAALAGLLLFAYRKYVLLSPDPTLSWVYHGTTFELLNPKMLGAILLAPWFVGVLARSLADLPWPQRLLSVCLRIAFVALLALGLSRPSRTATTEKSCAVYIIDVSDSISDEAMGDARAIVERAYAEKPKDGEIRVITFAKRPRLVSSAEDAEQAKAPAIERHRDVCAEGAKCDPGAAGQASNLQAALQLAYGLFPPGYLKRAVIVSDGLETDGDVLAEAARAKSFGVKLFTIPYDRPVPAEVAITNLRIPEHVKVGETFEIHADIYASQATTAQAKLYQGEAINGLDGVRTLELTAGSNDVVFKSVVRVAGQVSYALSLDKMAGDKFAANNRFTTTIDVPGRPSVLYVEGTPRYAGSLSAALTAQQLDVDVRPAAAFPGSLKELERYDFVIVSDVPKSAMSLEGQDLIEQYVRDLGGGFLFAGGEDGYGLGGWRGSTIERLLPVSMDNQRKKDMPSVAMALVIDRSGSMSGLPMEMAKSAAKATVETLGPDDLIEVIAFDTQPTRYVKMQPARNRSRISGDIARIQPGGGTEIFTALDAAYQDMTVTQARKKHVILLTDGQANSGSIRDLVTAMVAESITVTTVGLGGEVDEPLLRMIADVGGGRYHAAPEPNSLPRIFTKETEMIARSAAVEEWFPVTVVNDASFLRGLDLRTAPNLHGYVSTKMKSSPAQELLVSDTGEPILARWRVGLGWALAWTSDVKPRWAVEWLRWPGYSKFWGQLVHEHMRQKHRRELDMKTEVVGGVLHASIDAFASDDRFENQLVSRLTITPAAGGAKKTVSLRQTAPGRYEARAPLDGYGSFLLSAEHAREQPDGTVAPIAVSSGHVSNPYPREYASFEPDRARLERASTVTGGVLGPASVAAVFDAGGEKVSYHEDLWPKLIFAAIVVFLLDLLVRRVRLFDRKFKAAQARG